MRKGRTHVRVCVITAELLDAIRVRVQLAEEKGCIKRWWEGEHLTMAELVHRIVRTYWDHMERGRRKWPRGRRAGRAEGAEDAGFPLGDAALAFGHYTIAEVVEGIAQKGRKRGGR